MRYQSGKDYLADPDKRVLLFGMSGLGKTHISNILRAAGNWFHFSVDYRIGTRYMGEHIVDNFKREAMRNPFLANLLRTDSIYIASNITFNNLSPLSTYLGKPGNPDLGGIPIKEYKRRQEQHRQGEIAALYDTIPFIGRAHDLYGYANFVCDSGGSICEVVETADLSDPLMNALCDNLLLIHIEGRPDHTDTLVERFKKAPKPMYYQPEFLDLLWAEFLEAEGVAEDAVDPDAFLVFAYRRCLEHRLPRYRQMAQNWGLAIPSEEMAQISTEDDFNALVARHLDAYEPKT